MRCLIFFFLMGLIAGTVFGGVLVFWEMRPLVKELEDSVRFWNEAAATLKSDVDDLQVKVAEYRILKNDLATKLQECRES